MNKPDQQNSAEFEHMLQLFRGAVHHAASRGPAAPAMDRLHERAAQARKRRFSALLFAWTLGPALAAVLILGVFLRSRPASQPAAATCAADSALLDQVSDEISETAPGPLQPLYGPTTSTTHENTTKKVTR